MKFELSQLPLFLGALCYTTVKLLCFKARGVKLPSLTHPWLAALVVTYVATGLLSDPVALESMQVLSVLGSKLGYAALVLLVGCLLGRPRIFSGYLMINIGTHFLTFLANLWLPSFYQPIVSLLMITLWGSAAGFGMATATMTEKSC